MESDAITTDEFPTEKEGSDWSSCSTKGLQFVSLYGAHLDRKVYVDMMYVRRENEKILEKYETSMSKKRSQLAKNNIHPSLVEKSGVV